MNYARIHIIVSFWAMIIISNIALMFKENNTAATWLIFAIVIFFIEQITLFKEKAK